MELPSHAEVVALIDSFLARHRMAPSRLGRDALGEPQFVGQVREGRVPGLSTLTKLSDFMRERDERLAMAGDHSGAGGPAHRLSAGAR
ncbi:hypothetical protein [Sphingomonas sp.]|uniref:hypothetical protein n=1 Tax=Sphingomonas sp. TaxID=28214 RepID=UPI003CC60B65